MGDCDLLRTHQLAIPLPLSSFHSVKCSFRHWMRAFSPPNLPAHASKINSHQWYAVLMNKFHFRVHFHFCLGVNLPFKARLHVSSLFPSPSRSKFIIVSMETDNLTDRMGTQCKFDGDNDGDRDGTCKLTLISSTKWWTWLWGKRSAKLNYSLINVGDITSPCQQNWSLMWLVVRGTT